jgi:hypothetical protein
MGVRETCREQLAQVKANNSFCLYYLVNWMLTLRSLRYLLFCFPQVHDSAAAAHAHSISGKQHNIGGELHIDHHSIIISLILVVYLNSCCLSRFCIESASSLLVVVCSFAYAVCMHKWVFNSLKSNRCIAVEISRWKVFGLI